jgi:hypothetical protein
MNGKRREEEGQKHRQQHQQPHLVWHGMLERGGGTFHFHSFLLHMGQMPPSLPCSPHSFPVFQVFRPLFPSSVRPWSLLLMLSSSWPSVCICPLFFFWFACFQHRGKTRGCFFSPFRPSPLIFLVWPFLRRLLLRVAIFPFSFEFISSFFPPPLGLILCVPGKLSRGGGTRIAWSVSEKADIGWKSIIRVCKMINFA